MDIIYVMNDIHMDFLPFFIQIFHFYAKMSINSDDIETQRIHNWRNDQFAQNHCRETQISPDISDGVFDPRIHFKR